MGTNRLGLLRTSLRHTPILTPRRQEADASPTSGYELIPLSLHSQGLYGIALSASLHLQPRLKRTKYDRPLPDVSR